MESDITDVSAGNAVPQPSAAQGTAAQQGLDERGFAAAVGSGNGDVLAGFHPEIGRFGKSESGFAQKPVFEGDDGVRHGF